MRRRSPAIVPGIWRLPRSEVVRFARLQKWVEGILKTGGLGMTSTGRVDEFESMVRASLLSVSEVSTLLEVSKMTVYRMIHSGTLDAVRLGRSFRVSAESLQTRATTAAPQT